MLRRRIGKVLICSLFLILITTTVAGAVSTGLHPTADPSEVALELNANSTSIGPAVGSAHTTTLDQSFTYELLPERDGYIRITLAYDIPTTVNRLIVTLTPDLEDVELAGFDQDDSSEFEWTQSTRTPTITYTVPVNDYDQTRDGYRFYDAGDWAIVPTQQWGLSWRARGDDTTLETTHEVSGPGVSGNGVLYLGPHQSYTREATQETIRLVVPDAASLAESPGSILTALTNTSNMLTTGNVDEEITLIAAPTDDVNWGQYGGVQRGPSEAWVRDTAQLTAPANVWIHEYVHTKQAYRDNLTTQTRWLVEGHAEYYGVLLNHQLGYTRFSTFQTALERGADPDYNDIVLTDRSSWSGTLADYRKGALAIAAIDYEIRRATDGERSFQHVIRAMNRYDGTIQHDTFLSFVQDAGGTSAKNVAEEYTTTTRTPELWDEATHRALFPSNRASFTYRFANPPESWFRVTGEYRETTIGEPPELVVNETLSVPIEVENTGDRSGTYYATMLVDGEVVDDHLSSLSAGETTAVELSYRFTKRGTYRVVVASAETTVTVRRPATLTISNLTVSATTLNVGTNLTITTQVTNTNSVPGRRIVTITANNKSVNTKSVVLQPNTSTTITTTLRPTTTGPLTITAGNHSRTITITEADSPIIRTEQPGFGALGTILALIVVTVIHAKIRK